MSVFFMNFRRQIKGAYKSVKSNFREYVCLFLALIMVGVLFGTITIAFQNNRRVEYTLIKNEGYTYHAQLLGVTQSDANILASAYTDGVNQDSVFFEYKFENNKCLLTFKGDIRKARGSFISTVLSQMNAEYDRVTLSVTPLYDYEISKGSDIPLFLALLILMTVISFLLLMALFRIRINHFKFAYSIYMAFGGDFKKLMSSAFYEMLVMAIGSFPISALLSYGITALIYLPFGQPYGFYPLPLVIMIVFPLLAATLALVLPMRILSSGAPVKHMKAQDNSNLVVSPGKSRNFLKKNIVYTEFWTLWRFRKYIAVLLLSTVSFAVLFNIGCYLADVYTVRAQTVNADLTLSFSDHSVTEDFIEYFNNRADHYDIDSYVLEKVAVNPYDSLEENSELLPPHLTIPSSKVVSGGYTDHPLKNGYSFATALEIRAFDGDALDCMKNVYNYTWTGDPSTLLTDPTAIIVSSSFANHTGNTLSVGDVVYMPVDAVVFPVVSDPESEINENVPPILTPEMKIQRTLFVYRSFTVAAVIENYSSYSDMLVYLPTCTADGTSSAYEEVMGNAPDYSEMRVYLSDKEDLTQVSSFVQSYIDSIGGVSLKLDYGVLKDRVTEGQNYRDLILVLSCLILAVSPLAGFFSQIIFYRKRQLEFDVLRAVGGQGKDVFKIFFIDGLVISVLSGAIYAGCSVGAIHLFCSALNSPYILPIISNSTRASSFSPDIPVIPFILGLILTVLFSAGQAAICLRLCRKRSSDHVAVDFTSTEEH